MEWMTTIKTTIQYIEDNLLTVTGPNEVADYAHVSVVYLQRGFQVMTGYTIGEYIRNRRLFLAAVEISKTDTKIIDIAYKYGYETPEAFTKAFTRLHNTTPLEVRKTARGIQLFQPLTISISVRGGSNLNYKVENVKGFKIVGFAKEFTNEEAYKEIPKFWDEIFKKYGKVFMHAQEPKNELERYLATSTIGEFGICLDSSTDRFTYVIAGVLKGEQVPHELMTYEFPELDWAKFECVGPLPESLQSVNTKIWTEWLPGNNEYDMNGGYCVEWYSMGDAKSLDYRSEIWIPVKRKQ